MTFECSECGSTEKKYRKGLCRPCYTRKRYEAMPPAQCRLRKYGLDQEQYDAIVEKQGWKCAICGDDEPDSIDHCHETGVVRGLLCRLCNMGIGHFKDTPAFLRSAANYLEEFRQ